MASTYSDLKIELIGTGDQTGTWGATTNDNLSIALSEAITGSADVAFSSADVTVTLTNTNAAQTARNLRLNLTGTSGGARNLILGSGCQIEKLYLVNNGLADAVTVKNTTGTGIAVAAGKSMFVYNDGTNVVDATTYLSSLTLGTALPIASGGTGATSNSAARTNLGASTLGSNVFTITDPSAITFPRFNADNTVSALSASDFRTAIGAGTGGGSVSSVDVSGGTTGLTTSGGPITSSGTITLAGTLGVANGGTGATTLTTNNVILGNGTSAVQFVAPGANGNVLTSNGTTWTSTALAASGAPVGSLQYFSSGSAPITDATWLQCNGAIYTKTTYTALSAAIGSIPNVFSTNSGTIFNTSSNPQYIRVTTNGTNYYAAITYDFCGSSINTAYTSTDANTWTNTNVSNPGGIIYDVQYLNNLYVALTFTQSSIGSNALKTSTNFDSWSTRTVTTDTTVSFRVVRYLNSLFVVGGSGGFLATSTDAITWTVRTSGTSSTISGLAYGGGLYAYSGDGGVLATSTDAITWTARTSNTTSNLNNLVYANSKFYAIGVTAASISANGTTWTAYSSNANIGVNNLVYSLGDLFYGINASNNTAVWSANGVNWGTLTTSINNSGIATKTNQLMYSQVSSPYYLARAINPFNYSTSTQFAVPNQQATTSTTRIVIDDNTPLYIKAS